MTPDFYLTAVGMIGTGDLTDERLADVMTRLKMVFPDISAETLDRVRKQLEATIGITMEVGEGLHGGDQLPWLDDAKATIDWTYWQAYVNHLKASGFSGEVIRVLDEDTDNVLTECGNPKSADHWRVQGLVMGDVQSGKTANYCGLINKAADAGYKVIVLLTGMIEDLRAQSQERLDEGFVGRDSRAVLGGTRNSQAVGTGRFKQVVPAVLTSIESDFLTANGRALGGIPLANIKEPVLLVMKKNRSPLENLIAYLTSQAPGGVLKLPALVLDDEADNASVNAKKDEDPATINRLIRALLGKFKQAAYVGYTATPFANVFISPDNDDLFPSNFVYSLNAPSHYIGARSLFSDDGAYNYQVQDNSDASVAFPYKHKKELQIEKLPVSLLEAVGVFFLSCAIRDLRKEPLRHRSMLVNVTRFTDVQGRLAEQLKRYTYDLTEEIKQYIAADSLWSKHPPLRTLHELWRKHYEKAGPSWDEVRLALYEAVASVKVITVNQKSEERLSYGAYRTSDRGRRVIAVGGLTLSRGLTLEGLCVSYFFRDSRAYDTLLQMGRWFGYRPGYDDLCRIWMDPAVQDWFAHIADVVAELRADMRRMHANRQPPKRFGMRVKSHPDTLTVTAANKMRNAEEMTHSVSFSGRSAETPFLPRSVMANASNVETIGRFLTGLKGPTPMGTRLYWTGVGKQEIASLLRNLQISNTNMEFMEGMNGAERPLLSFIANNTIEDLQEWDVCVPSGDGKTPVPFSVTSKGMAVKPAPRERQFEKVSVGADYLKLNKQRVGEIADEKAGLSRDDIKAADDAWEEEREKDPEKGERVPGYMYRRYRKRPLLTISLIEPSHPTPDSKRASLMMRKSEIDSPLFVGLSISFPRFEEGEDEKSDKGRVFYAFNRVALRNLGLVPEAEDDEDQD